MREHTSKKKPIPLPFDDRIWLSRGKTVNNTKQRKHIVERTLGVFAWLSLFLAIVTAIITVFASLSGEQNGKDVFGHKILIVTSDSMSKSPLSNDEEVFFNAGDIIIISGVEDATKFEAGDVITFVSNNPESYGKTVTHKIRELKYNPNGDLLGYITYGVNTGKNDMVIVSPENVVGEYQFRVPKIGYLFSFLKTERGYYLSLIIPTVLLIIFFSIKIGKTLGRLEFAKLYTKEIEEIKKRLAILEHKSVPLHYVPMSATVSQPIIQRQMPSPVILKPIKTADAEDVKKKPITEPAGSGIVRLKKAEPCSEMGAAPQTRIKFGINGIRTGDNRIRCVVSDTALTLPEREVIKLKVKTEK